MYLRVSSQRERERKEKREKREERDEINQPSLLDCRSALACSLSILLLFLPASAAALAREETWEERAVTALRSSNGAT